jgi:hypothetical protein
MIDQKLVDDVREELYPLKILQAFNNNSSVIPISTELIKTVSKIYRYLEPSHINGKLIIYRGLSDTELLPRNQATIIFNWDELTQINTDNIIIESLSNEQLYLWTNIDNDDFLVDTNTIFYCYRNNDEYFHVNQTQVKIPHSFECSSRFALQYVDLEIELKRYKNERVVNSNCGIFKSCWYDANRIFFKSAPEETMQESLKEFLTSALRGVEVVREYNLNTAKPVDIRVKWTEANKSALIELKWLGKSKKESGGITTYTDSRANDGAKQLKEYLDMDNSDTPNIISKAYLVVIDGRRKGTNENTTTINFADGLHYENQEINFSDEHKYFDRLKNFASPVRMFAKPIIS